MLEFDKGINLLMQNKYRYSLQDVKEPNLYREIYDYKSIPKIPFNMRHVPEEMPDEIWMTDTTFRDGQQSVSPFTPEQIVHLFKLMSRLGGENGMVRQSEFFLYTENDQKALHMCQDLGLKFPEITTWIRANKKDFELVKNAGVQETGILVSCSDYHIFNKMHLTRAEAMDKYLGIVCYPSSNTTIAVWMTGFLQTAEELGYQPLYIGGDTTDAAAVEQMIDGYIAQYGDAIAGSYTTVDNCLFYGCAPCQDGADEDNKFSSYQLLDSGFFTDYARGDFHPNPNLPESWVDPCGLRFDDPDCGTQVFSCRDLDGYRYEFSSPWPNCPGCYRFRSDEYVSNIPSSTAKAGGGRISSRKVHSPSVRRGTRTLRKSSLQLASGTSVRNRPIKVITRRTGPALMDLSELPCEFTQDEILHEDENLLDFTAPWYKLSGACERLFDLCGPVKMPEVGKDPGYGCPGKITPYAEDDELRSLERKYGFRSGWFHRGFPKKGDRYYQTYLDRLKCWEQRTNQVLDCQTCTVEKVPFLFSQASGKGKLPLVVYIAGSGEQGTDLKKMFGQTGVFDAVREPSFAMNCPCHLLAIMPPEFAHRLANVYYPHYYADCIGQRLLDHPLYGLDLIRMYADLIFALQRELETKGKGGFDPSAIVLTGLGSGSSAALTMMREYPGRYVGVCATFPSMWYLLPTANRYRPGRWWFAVSEEYHENDERINAAVNACKQVGADVRLDYYPNGDNWWNRQYSSLEFQDWLVHCFESGILHGERLIVSRSERETDLLLAKTGPDEVTYYGTVRERPEGLPKEVADKRVKDMKGIRYLYVDGHVGAIPPEAFAHSPDLETVHFKLYAITNDAKSAHWKIDLTNIAERAFADSSKLKLVIYESAPAPKIAIDAFDGCAPQLYGATVGVPCTVSYWVGWGTSHAKYVTKKVNLNTQALPVDGLCSMRLFLCDDQLGRHLYIDDDYLWSEEEEGVNVLMYLGESRDVFVPDKIRGRPVVAGGRNFLHRRGGFEYGTVVLPATARSVNFSYWPTIKRLYRGGSILYESRQDHTPREANP